MISALHIKPGMRVLKYLVDVLAEMRWQWLNPYPDGTLECSLPSGGRHFPIRAITDVAGLGISERINHTIMEVEKCA
jgi:hypothetical protein